MYDLFFQKFRVKTSLTIRDEDHIRSYLTPKKLRKRQYILQDGHLCKCMMFVVKGILRKYLVDDAGEHIIQFAFEGWTISDLCSFLTGKPTMYNIDAIEDSDILIIVKEDYDELLLTSPKYERYMRLLITNAYIALQERLSTMMTLPVEDRYSSLIRAYPHLAQRFPNT